MSGLLSIRVGQAPWPAAEVVGICLGFCLAPEQAEDPWNPEDSPFHFFRPTLGPCPAGRCLVLPTLLSVLRLAWWVVPKPGT